MKKFSINWLGLGFALKESAIAVVDCMIQIFYSIVERLPRRKPVVDQQQIELDEYERMLS